MQRLYPAEYAAKLPSPDGESITTLSGPVLVQIVDVLDIQTSISSQLEKLYLARDRVKDISSEDKGEQEDEHPNGAPKMLRYTVRDTSGQMLYLIYDVAPSQLPRLGSFVIVKNCDLHRGILVANEAAVKVLPHQEEIHLDQIAKLEALLASQS